MIRDWVTLHYAGKKGTVFTEHKEFGEFLSKKVKAKYLREIETEIGTYYEYEVEDLEMAYKNLMLLYQLSLRY